MTNPSTSRPGLSRRTALAATGACLATLGRQIAAATAPAGSKPRFAKETETAGMREITGIHHGKGTGRAKLFRFEGAAAPANFMTYDLPPGASEGVHIHYLDDRNRQGPFDEYYYIVSGEGQMEIDGEIVTVAAGDHVHTPLDVAHGVENTHPTESLRVFLTFIDRATAAPAARLG